MFIQYLQLLWNICLEPISDYYSPTSRHNNAERLNPWNRYNSQRYSDDEQERNVVYPKTMLR